MNERKTLYLAHAEARRRAADLCRTLPDGWRVRFDPPPKSRDQEEKYHAMIGDIADQYDWLGQDLSRDEWKRLLITAYVAYARENAKSEGRPDPFASRDRILIGLDGETVVHCTVSSKEFSKRQAGEFIEFLYGFAETLDPPLQWSEEAAP